jgi:hypothetical protein
LRKERKRERGGCRENRNIYMCNPNGIFVNICGYKNKNPNGIFVNICGARRGGLDNIRYRPNLRVGANFLTRNRPATSTGQVKLVRGGAGRVGAGQNCHPYFHTQRTKIYFSLCDYVCKCLLKVTRNQMRDSYL